MDAEELINRYKKGERYFSGIKLISDLNDVSLEGINLTLSNLKGVKFERVSFKNSKFIQVNLHSSEMTDVDLSGVKFKQADLGECNWNRINLGQYPISGYELLTPNEAATVSPRYIKLPLWSDILMAPELDTRVEGFEDVSKNL